MSTFVQDKRSVHERSNRYRCRPAADSPKQAQKAAQNEVADFTLVGRGLESPEAVSAKAIVSVIAAISLTWNRRTCHRIP